MKTYLDTKNDENANYANVDDSERNDYFDNQPLPTGELSMEEIEKPPTDDFGWKEALGEHANNPTAVREVGDTLITNVCFDCDGTGCILLKNDTKECPTCNSTGLNQQVWTVSECETRIMAQFEAHVLSEAKKGIAQVEMEDGPDEAAHYRTALISSRGAGHYKWDGRACRQARADLPGLKYLFYILLKRCHPKMTEQLAEKIFNVTSVNGDLKYVLAWATNAGNCRTLAKQGRTLGAKKNESNGTGKESTTETNQNSPTQ